MSDITPREAALLKLFASYPNTAISEATAAVYVELLQDVPTEPLVIVINQCIADCKFLPTVAELRERYHGLTRTIHQLTPAEAWAQVQAEIKRIGSWGAPRFDNPLIAQIVRSMGWINLCQSDEPGVDRAQFMRMYEQIINREEQVRRLLPQARALLEAHTPEPAQLPTGPRRIADLLRNAQLAPEPIPTPEGDPIP